MLAESRCSIDRLLGLWDYLVDVRVGVVKRILELPIDSDDPNLFHFLSRACNTARFNSLTNFADNGGVSTNRYAAIAKALGEAVERYCSAIFRYDDLVLSPFQDLDGQAVHPSRFALYRWDQYDQPEFPWRPFTAEGPVYWTRGVSLITGRSVLVPASMVYVPFHYPASTPNTPIVQPISTGLACGCSFAEAALSGLCEVIERDAFSLAWQLRLSRPLISADSVPDSVKDLVGRYAAVNLCVELVDITTDLGVTAVMTIAISDASTSPALAFAAASDVSPERALLKSLEELAHTRKYAKQVMEYTPALPVDVEAGHPAVTDPQKHLRFYCPQQAKPFAEFAWSGTETVRFEHLPDWSGANPDETLHRLVASLAGHGFETIACDLTTPDIAPLGLRVVRVIVPGLHPLFMGYRNRALGGSRLNQISAKLRGSAIGEEDFDNPYPHPFP